MVDERAFDSVGNLLQGGQLVFDLIANLSKKQEEFNEAEQNMVGYVGVEKRLILTLIVIMLVMNMKV